MICGINPINHITKVFQKYLAILSPELKTISKFLVIEDCRSLNSFFAASITCVAGVPERTPFFTRFFIFFVYLLTVISSAAVVTVVKISFSKSLVVLSDKS